MTAGWPFEDMHVHSTFSDGAATVEENIERAIELGLTRLTCVDHVRRDTDWLPEFVSAVEPWRGHRQIEVLCGIEAKILTLEGDLDLPGDTSGVDRIYVADHQMPGPDGPIHPRDVAAALVAGEASANRVVSELVDATAAGIARDERSVIAHLFSILPKLGLDESAASRESIDALADCTARVGARIEIDERWRCPGPWVVRPFLQRGVEILASTDSHRLETLGQFAFVRSAFESLGVGPSPPGDDA